MAETDSSIDAAVAICGAHLMVAFADARYEASEEGRFLATVANEPGVRAIDAAAISASYNELEAAFREDYAAAADRVVAALAALDPQGETAALARMAARRAIVADQRLRPQEESALQRIAAAMGLEKDAL